MLRYYCLTTEYNIVVVTKKYPIVFPPEKYKEEIHDFMTLDTNINAESGRDEEGRNEGSALLDRLTRAPGNRPSLYDTL